MKSTPRLGRLQLQIMQVLWRKGHATARDITDTLNADQAIAHSTVQTLLRKLETKGAVSHEAHDRTFVFFPLIKNENVTRSAIRDMLDRLFAGSPAGLVSYLLKNERISKAEMEQIRKLIREED